MTVITRSAVKQAKPHSPQGRSVRRDTAVDVARAWCLTVVVVLHALMVGVTVGVDGPVLENALESWPGLAPFTWLAQIMPLFFVLGGFSAFTQWSRLSARGMSASGYVGIRMRRLLGPSVIAIAAMVVTLAALSTFGMPQDLVAVAGFRLSQPLWFLGVYAGATALVPALFCAHRRAPVRTLAVLVALAAGVDVLRAATGLTGIGYLNLAFVWLLVQQLGFWLADNRLPRPRAAVAAIAVAAYGLLAVLCATGVFSFDLLADLNPPSCALVLLGVGQLALFELCRPALRRMHGLRSVGIVATAINLRAMTIYLWHMLMLVLAAGTLLLVGARLPHPLSSEWWASRPLWLACVVAVVTLVAWGAGRWEIARAGVKCAWETGRVAASVSPVLAMAGVVVLLATGFTIAGGVVGLVCVAGALALASRNGGRDLDTRHLRRRYSISGDLISGDSISEGERWVR
ncbi:MAG TPA: acyltransferase [Humibacter sp.]|nr:acyltransferase [Humibacter sp.]